MNKPPTLILVFQLVTVNCVCMCVYVYVCIRCNMYIQIYIYHASCQRVHVLCLKCLTAINIELALEQGRIHSMWFPNWETSEVTAIVIVDG